MESLIFLDNSESTLAPIMLSKVSLSMSILALIMTIEMITPRIPSREILKNIEIIAAISVERDRIASKNASLPEATRAWELISSPTRFTYWPKTNFTTTATAIIRRETLV